MICSCNTFLNHIFYALNGSISAGGPHDKSITNASFLYVICLFRDCQAEVKCQASRKWHVNKSLPFLLPKESIQSNDNGRCEPIHSQYGPHCGMQMCAREDAFAKLAGQDILLSGRRDEA